MQKISKKYTPKYTLEYRIFVAFLIQFEWKVQRFSVICHNSNNYMYSEKWIQQKIWIIGLDLYQTEK
jgi:hypothetical protein